MRRDHMVIMIFSLYTRISSRSNVLIPTFVDRRWMKRSDRADINFDNDLAGRWRYAPESRESKAVLGKRDISCRDVG